MRRWTGHHLNRSALQLAGLTALMALLYVGASVGLAYVAGFSAVRHRLVHPAWPWLAASFGGALLSFAGYYFGYRGVDRVVRGPDLDRRSRLTVVTAGFGGFFAQGGGAIDEAAFQAAGAEKRDAKLRVTLLGGLEHGILSLPCSIAAIVLLVLGIRRPPSDYTLPWAIGPAAGFAIAFWAARRYRERWRGRQGWRGRAVLLLDVVKLFEQMARQPIRYAAALLGMLAFWLLDMFALWAALAAFHLQMNVGSEVVAFGTAMVVTRRLAPLGGAGLIDVVLPPMLFVSGAPWAAAVVGAFAYRFFMLWLPLPFAFAELPQLRELVKEGRERVESEAEEEEPALR